MTTNIYIFIVSAIFIIGYICIKYFLHRKEILSIGDETSKTNSIDEVKNLIFAFFDDVKNIFERNFKIILHWVLHLFVIILGFLSDLTDILYARARDFFLRTATKEKEVVTKFWHHLKEYKREKEEEKVN